jgi:NDP-sugar pyrophosphorylase family protein
MDAMILAAGLGTRLRPLTDTVPKALIEVGGVTLLSRTVDRLAAAGANRIIVNVHHHAGQIEEFLDRLAARRSTPLELVVSREEDVPLETGGGLLHAAGLFRRDVPFFLHNVDVIADFDLSAMYQDHLGSGALATLAVGQRGASRYLLFDDEGLCGRLDVRTGREDWARAPRGSTTRAGFTGVHSISPAIFDELEENGAFSIVDAYLRLAAAGHWIRPHDVTDALWIEVGTPERLEAARRALIARRT